MSGCLALSKDCRLCSNYAAITKDPEGNSIRGFTCKQHIGFFKDPKKIKRLWFVAIGWKGGYAHYLHVSPWIIKWIESCIIERVIHISREDIQTLLQRGSTTAKWGYFLLLCARHVEGFSYSWNPKLWETTVRTLWIWSKRIGAIQITNKDLQEFTCVKGGLIEFYKGLVTIANEQNTEDVFQYIEDCSINKPEWFETFLGIPIEEHNKHVSGLTTQVRYTAWILTKKKRLFDKHVARTQLIKQELLAVTWHPSRSRGWIFTSDELKEIGERWNEPGLIDPPYSCLREVLKEVADIFI